MAHTYAAERTEVVQVKSLKINGTAVALTPGRLSGARLTFLTMPSVKEVCGH